MSFNSFNLMQLDALKEVGNIGSGNAATALSQLLNRKIDMNVPSINIISFQDIFSSIGGEDLVVGIIVRVLGDTPGSMLYVLDMGTALSIIESLTGEIGGEISEMGDSVLREIGNIISGSYLNAIAMLTNLLIIPSVPAVATDMLGAILSTTFIESGQYDDFVLDIESVFKQGENSEIIGGHFYFIPMPGSLEIILNKLGLE